MPMPRLFVDCSLLRTNAHYRQLLLARTISLMSLGALAVSVPIQVYGLTGSSFQVGLVSALDGAGMFIGLMLGGVLSDLYDRRRLILLARSICGVGFVALAANSLLETPSLTAIYALAFWDGFFGALGVSALMAAMPQIVGRENLMQAGALGMLTARFASIVSPALGGMIIAWAGLAWNYGLAAFGTLVTVLTLLGLPRLVPERPEVSHPLTMLFGAFSFLFRHRTLLAVFALGSVLTLTSSVRILFPALVEDVYGLGAFETGLMYSAVPLGATLGAALSGWAHQVRRPEWTMVGMTSLAFAAIVGLGLAQHFAFALGVLVVYGYATAISGLLQYTLVQAHTPDAYLGRINSLWVAQDSLGDIVGASGIGILAKLLPGGAIIALGTGALVLGGALAGLFRTIRPEVIEEAVAEPSGSVGR